MKQWCIRWRDKKQPEKCGIWAGPWENINTAHSTFGSIQFGPNPLHDIWVDECIDCPENCQCDECICPDCGISRDECDGFCSHDEYCGCDECCPHDEECCDDPVCWCATDDTYDAGI